MSGGLQVDRVTRENVLHGSDCFGSQKAGDAATHRALVVAHAAGASAQASFGPLAQYLPSWELVGPDYPGTINRPTVADQIALEELADLVVAAGVASGAEQFPILGQSLGAAVAISAAARHPEIVTALVLTVGFLRLDQHGRDFMSTWQSLHDAHDEAALGRHLLRGVTTPTQCASLPGAARHALVERLLAGDAAGGHLHARLAAHLDVTTEARNLQVPVLAITAAQDQIVTPAVSDDLVAAIPCVQRHTIPRAGHAFGPPQASEWAHVIRDFLPSE